MPMLRLLLALSAICFPAPAALAHKVVHGDAVFYTQAGEVPVQLELVTTPEARAEGLMNRDSMGPMDGMLFLFPTCDDHTFWMKNTRMPLDMLFIREDHTIAHIAQATPHSLAAQRAGEAVCAVIELDGGRAEREGIAVGDHVRYELPETLEIR